MVDVHLNWLDWFHFLIVVGGLIVIVIDWIVYLSPFLDAMRMSMLTFFSCYSYTMELSPLRMLSFNMI